MGLLKRKYHQLITVLKYPHYKQSPKSLCKILKSDEEINECTRFLYRLGLEPHGLACKNWDLANIIPEIDSGNFLDMGSSDSYILKNLAIKKIRGELNGIDLREPSNPVPGVKYSTGDLLNTKFPDNYFKNITCLSVIEHEVDFHRFAKETSRLLENGGKLFVTFDYWNPKVISQVKLYGLAWQPLDKQLVIDLITECERQNLYPVQEMDWALGQAVINNENHSPDPSVSYTFGIVTFEKRDSSRARR